MTLRTYAAVVASAGASISQATLRATIAIRTPTIMPLMNRWFSVILTPADAQVRILYDRSAESAAGRRLTSACESVTAVCRLDDCPDDAFLAGMLGRTCSRCS